MGKKRENVWLAVAGLVVSEDGEWLVVKKKYGGLKGKWSFPAGFVEGNETIDEAVIREVKEETGIDCVVQGIVGVRSGVLHEKISDNMIIFLLKPLNAKIIIQEEELMDVKYVHPNLLKNDETVSVIIKQIIDKGYSTVQQLQDGLNPGKQFGYTSYKLFL
ncbi:NUDIX hydrolase [Bacillus timonensis]|nr:NUDIX hydrolase [Bacillus timonensis]